jgi:hypothetical protein
MPPNGGIRCIQWRDWLDPAYARVIQRAFEDMYLATASARE